MPGFDELIDQERPVHLLETALASGHIPHAFLFTGLNGVGKKSAALSFAMVCNCYELRNKAADSKRMHLGQSSSATPCGSCGSCKKIISGTHPDIHVVKPAGTIIKVEQIRALCRRLTLKPNEASIRLAVISDAHMLNPEAGNTLLKTLEEPPDNTIFILTALQATDLLPTIVSRCRHIRFNPISRVRLASFLTGKYGLDLMEANVIAAMSDGSFTTAINMLESNWIKKRNSIIEHFEFLSCNSIRFSLAFSETLSKNKKWLSDAFFIMKMWYRDIVVFNFSPNHIVYMDLWEKIKSASLQTTVEKTLYKIRAIEESEKNISANANIRTTLDALFIKLFGE